MAIRPGKAKGPSVAPTSGGGGGGNLSGTLTNQHMPVATGAHTLGDTPLIYDGTNFSVLTGNLGVAVGDVNIVTGRLYLATGGIQVDQGGLTLSLGNILVSAGDIRATLGTVRGEFIHADSDSFLDGTVHVGVPGILVNTNKWTVDGATGDVLNGGTLDVKSTLTYEKDTIAGIYDIPGISGAGNQNVPIDCSQADIFFLDLASIGTVTIQAPTNAARGKRITLKFRNIGGVPYTLVWDAIYQFPGGAPSMDTSLNAYWYIGFIYNDSRTTWDCIGPLTGPFT